ncbi:unnamed protein product [Mytilus edulis]|uniref:Fibronectin type-III domain-containing protein n=1 Tax=Mytilus edulis TaxID=6550 RepID=A0A8S3V3T9_MYTED|nr:unnamed protein product [Mytilus edulis]
MSTLKVKQEKSCIPDKLNLIKASSSEITLRWDAPPAEYKISYYEIRYRESTEQTSRWNIFETDDNRTTATIIDLKAGAEFEVKVRAVDINGEEGPYHPSIKVATIESLANKVRMRATLHSDGCPSVYLLPMKHEKMFDNKTAKARKFVLGKTNVSCVPEKTVLIIGASKSGKSLTIDGMVNYILGVSWNEDYRFSLAQELSGENITDTDDKTEWITCIRVNHSLGSKIDYNINIIEIPGFGNLEKDKQIVNRIQDYFTTEGEQGITCLNAICLVIPASTALSTEQKYIFDAILSIFDKKVAENLLILATFGDGDEPQVIEALNVALVPYKKCLQVNNVAWFGSNKNRRLPNEIYWDMSYESFKTFFLEIEKAESISLLLTKVVLKNREKIEATIRGLLPQIEEGTNKLNTLQEEVHILERHKADVEEFKDFKYKVTETHQRKVDLETGKYVTNCLQCNRTCHYPCALSDDSRKASCVAMNDGNCMVCPGKCHWQKHKNNSYRFEVFPIEVEKTYEDIKRSITLQKKTHSNKKLL